MKNDSLDAIKLEPTPMAQQDSTQEIKQAEEEPVLQVGLEPIPTEEPVEEKQKLAGSPISEDVVLPEILVSEETQIIEDPVFEELEVTPTPIRQVISANAFSLNYSNSKHTGDSTPKFEWSVTTPAEFSTTADMNIVKYEVYIGTSADNLEKLDVTNNAYYQVPVAKELKGGVNQDDKTSYYWQVKALNSEGEIVGESSVANFTFIKSLVGHNTLAKGIYLHSSGDNPVWMIRQHQVPAIYGGGWENVHNDCLPDGYGFADPGDSNANGWIAHTRNHSYKMDFDDSLNVKDFSLQMVDWADYLPYGGNAEGVYWAEMYAYDASGNILDHDRISFTTTATGLSRPNLEFRHTRESGDACMSNPGEPGNYTFNLSSTQRIDHVTFGFKDRASMDPNTAFRFPRLNGVSVHLAKVTGRLFLDYDKDNVKDANEPGAPLITITLNTQVESRTVETINNDPLGKFESEIDGTQLSLTVDESDAEMPVGYYYAGPTQFTLVESVDNDLGDLPLVTNAPAVTATPTPTTTPEPTTIPVIEVSNNGSVLGESLSPTGFGVDSVMVIAAATLAVASIALAKIMKKNKKI